MPLCSLFLLVLLALALLPSAAQAAPEILLPLDKPEPLTLTLKVPDIKGSYTIPCLQNSPDVRLRVQWAVPAQRARVTLLLGEQTVGERETDAAGLVSFEGLGPGEYSLRVAALDAQGREVANRRFERLGVGTVIGALGDSITEGYHSRWYWRDNLDLTAADFPAEAVSRDGRNYPQYTPTTAWHRPEVNCFQSWMTSLNNRLAERWQRPVFIANEGVGGITTAAYLQTMRTDAGWQARMRLLQPSVWLIHLGVNDERAKAPAETVGRNLEAIVDLLISDYGARPERIYLARPCYDYADGAAAILQTYIVQIEELVQRRGLARGPDFYRAYAEDKAKWYGEDPVHPNLVGMEEMARLWAEALTGQSSAR